jgi:hypothetical protein
VTAQLDFTLHHVKIRWHFDAFLFLNGPPGKWNAAMKVHPLGSFMKGHLDIYFPFSKYCKSMIVYVQSTQANGLQQAIGGSSVCSKGSKIRQGSST